jgi:phenylacetate-CoA ligase
MSNLTTRITGNLLLRATHLLRRSSTLEMFETIKSEPFTPRSEMVRRQFERLSHLLTIAETHVPYYREMFRSLGINASDVRSLRDFASLPILTKETIRQRLNDFVREDIPKEELIAIYSGGSTGVPLKFYTTLEELSMSEAGFFRSCQQSGWRLGEMIAYFWGDRDTERMSNLEFEFRQYLRRMYQFDAFHSEPAQMDRWIVKWSRVKPSIVYGYTSAIYRFAMHVESAGKKIDPVRAVFTTAEKLYPKQREVISRIFASPVYDMYGSSEINNIACTCPKGRMHVNIDNVLLETDRSGMLPGQPSAFIVTSLRRSAMPFIRYRNDDCGELLDATCNCGNQFPLMELDISRIFDHFILPDGRVIHGMLFTRIMDVAHGISTFQFHQTAPNSVTLSIVPGPGNDSARGESIRKIVEQVRALDPNGRIQVDVRMVDSIPLSRNGKHRYVRSDVRPTHAPGSGWEQATA